MDSSSPLIILADNKEKLEKLINLHAGKRQIFVFNNKREDMSLSLYLRELETSGIKVFYPNYSVDIEEAEKTIQEHNKKIPSPPSAPPESDRKPVVIPQPDRDFPFPLTEEQRNIKGIKLHLGCGNIYLNDFTNVDLDNPVADKLMDASNLRDYRDNSVSLIIASHIIEHFAWNEHEKVLKEWHRVLMPGSWLIVEAPNLVEGCKHFLEEQDDAKRIALIFPQIFGRPDFSKGNIHLSGVWHSYLHRVLIKVGFKETIERLPIKNSIQSRCLRVDARK